MNNDNNEEKESILDWLLGYMSKPWVCFLSAFVGIALGLWSNTLAASLAPVGDIYMTLLTLTVTPIIFSALASGICRLLMSESGKSYVGRIVSTLLFGTFFAGFIGTFVGAVALPLLTGIENRAFVGKTLDKFQGSMSSADAAMAAGHGGFWGFVQSFIPSNIFDALSKENLLAIVFLATLVGVALCSVSSKKREVAIDFIGAMYEISLRVLEWVLCLLPIGMCCLMASQAAKVGVDALSAMLVIIALYLVCFAVMAVMYMLAIVRSTGRSLTEVFSTLKEPMTLAFIASSDSALPSSMEKMAKLGLPHDLLGSAIPLSAAMNRHGTAIIFALTTLFVADIYDVDLNLWQCLFVGVASSIVGAFDSGEYVTIAPMIAYILIPLDLPASAGIAIIFTIWPMIEWFPELQCVMAACANAAIIGNIPQKNVTEGTL